MANNWTRLRRLRRARLDEFEQVISSMDHSLSDAELDGALRRLERIDALISVQARMASRTQRLVVLAGVLLFAGVVIAAASIDMPTARVEVKARATEVRFRTTSDQRITDLISASDISVAGVARVDGPEVLGFGPTSRDFRIASASEAVVMEPIEVTAASEVAVERTGPRRYRVTIRPGSTLGTAEVALSLTGPVEAVVEAADGTVGNPVVARLAAPRQVSLTGGPGEPLILTLSTPDTVLIKPVAISALSFERLDQVADQIVPTSALMQAELRFSDYQKPAVSIGESDRLVLTGLSGHAKGVVENDGALSTRFTGEVTGAFVGDGPVGRNELPSVLDRVTQHAQWVAVGSTLGALLAAVLGAWTWWRDEV